MAVTRADTGQSSAAAAAAHVDHRNNKDRFRSARVNIGYHPPRALAERPLLFLGRINKCLDDEYPASRNVFSIIIISYIYICFFLFFTRARTHGGVRFCFRKGGCVPPRFSTAARRSHPTVVRGVLIKTTYARRPYYVTENEFTPDGLSPPGRACIAGIGLNVQTEHGRRCSIDRMIFGRFTRPAKGSRRRRERVNKRRARDLLRSS